MNSSRFCSLLFSWYDLNKRDLPWRNEKDPYKIWISEIILQQTRVNQGWDYYLRFIERFPDILAIYQGGEEEVLKYWQGLGYYTRARNIYAAAVYIIETQEGVFPKTYNELLKIKGVGEYTAAAIASFAFGLPHAVVDGNVMRIISRIWGIYDPIDSSIGKKKIREIANRLISKTKPDIFNQAIMDFGATHCRPLNPHCQTCSFATNCHANKHFEQENLPVKQHKTKVRNRYFYYFHIENENFTYLQKRNQQDIWKGLYEFPLLETSKPITENEILASSYLNSLLDTQQIKIQHITPPLKHVLSHQVITAVFVALHTKENILSKNIIRIHKQELSNYPISRLMEKYLDIYPL